MHNAFVLKVGYWVVLAEYFTLPHQFWALQGDAKSAETTDDRSYLQVQTVSVWLTWWDSGVWIISLVMDTFLTVFALQRQKE